MAIGLDDVVAAETMLSDVDGARGQLVIRGHRLDELAGRASFEQVTALLFDGLIPLPAAMPAAMGAARGEVFACTRPLLPLLADLPVYDAMRAAVALLADGTETEDALMLVAAPGVLIPALLRQAEGRDMIAPDPTLGHAADAVRMLGLGRDAARAAALDTYLVTVSDHGLNASTFAARVVASTAAGLTSAVLAGLGALKGPLHGGAPGPVLDMLDAIAAAGDARAWLSRAVARGERLMGFGHRIYRVRDPRADALKAAVALLPQTAGRLAEAQAVEAVALDVLRAHRPGRVLETNVEFYTALLLEAVGFPREAFTGVFAMGRVAGWVAHAREQALTGRLIRPQSRYVAHPPVAA
ncbi:MAG: citrate synthase [Sphingomonas adhaesiva]|uniref:citrate synthase n=1 Tax=Sphingomonas adhaesiva TaxID=28212 RepID=UPI002FF8EDCE